MEGRLDAAAGMGSVWLRFLIEGLSPRSTGMHHNLAWMRFVGGCMEICRRIHVWWPVHELHWIMRP